MALEPENEIPSEGTASGPLQGIRVLDLTTILLGPIATQILGDMGADVIKIEAPKGDPMRQIGPPPANGMGAMFLGMNRNKRGIVLDLKLPKAMETLYHLTADADIFVHNMRTQAAQRLGIDYGTLKAINPNIIYCGTYGFRAGGPYGHKPAFDDMIQAASGLAHLQGADGPPRYVTSDIADKVTAITVVYAISMALIHKLRTGHGQEIEVPMFETMAAFNLLEHFYGLAYDPPRGQSGYPRLFSPDRRPFATRDGYIGVLPYTDQQWQAIFRIAGRDDLADDPKYRSLADRLANIDTLYAELAQLLKDRTTAEWLDILDAANVPAMAVLSPEDLVEDPHLEAIGFWHKQEDQELGNLRFPGIPTQFSESPGSFRRMVPRLGEHTVEVLREAGIAESDISELLSTGAGEQANL